MKLIVNVVNYNLDSKVVILGVKSLENQGRVKIDHICTCLAKNLEQRGGAPMQEPIQHAPFRSQFSVIFLLNSCSSGPNWYCENIRIIHWRHSEEIYGALEHLLRHFCYRNQCLQNTIKYKQIMSSLISRIGEGTITAFLKFVTTTDIMEREK